MTLLSIVDEQPFVETAIIGHRSVMGFYCDATAATQIITMAPSFWVSE